MRTVWAILEVMLRGLAWLPWSGANILHCLADRCAERAR